MKLLCLVIVCWGIMILPARAAQESWNGGSGEWGNPAAWTPPGVPDPADEIEIGNSSVSLGGTVVISNRL